MLLVLRILGVEKKARPGNKYETAVCPGKDGENQIDSRVCIRTSHTKERRLRKDCVSGSKR